MAEAREVEELLLGEPLTLTMDDVALQSGMDLAYAQRIWTALGFPTPPPSSVAFTAEDVQAMKDIRSLLGHQYVDDEMVLQLARGVGQTMSRLASWLGEVWLERLTELLVAPGEAVTSDTVAQALAASAELRPRFEQLLLRGWRRQMAAAGIRALTSTADPSTGTATLAVGFADIVSFTSLSRRLDGPALASLINDFEATTTGIIASQGGRVIKTLGDEVLFVAQDAPAVAEIALRISEWSAASETPSVRVGLAYGEVILRLGDVFGTPVNMAARLTASARPGKILVSPSLAAELDGYSLRGVKPRSLQGLGRVRPYRLSRLKRIMGPRTPWTVS